MRQQHTRRSVKFFLLKAELFADTEIKELVDALEGQQVWVFAELVSMERKRGRRQIAECV